MTQGLTSLEAKEYLLKYGLNSIEVQRKRNALLIFLGQFTDILSILLFIAGGLSFIIGATIDSFLIVGVIVLNAFFKIYQEKKAEEALAALKKITITSTRVIRDGKEMEIDSRYLVPQDVIMIEEGSKIPADAKLIEAVNLEVNEASLTGESMPIYKITRDQIFMGTIVTRGRGCAQIMTTGMHTKFGQIAVGLSKIKEISTPLQQKLNEFIRKISLVGILISLLVIGLSFLRGSTYLPAFILAISLAVAIVPEGLPAVMTITLALGVREMVKKKAIVRKLEAIEAIGNVTLIATDKTGTLTMNEMKVKDIWIKGKTDHSFSTLLTNSVLCSTASLVKVHDHGHEWEVLGDPTEGALLIYAKQYGISSEELKKNWQFISEVPFNSEDRLMSVTMKDNKGSIITYTKGAPESVLSRCEKIMIGDTAHQLTEKERKEIKTVLDQWTSKGLRVLAFSYHEPRTPNPEPSVFIGMVALHDPPRLEAKEAVEKAEAAGIKVVMITGDNEKTAEAIGAAVGIIQEGDYILTGKQIEESTDEELLEKLLKVKAFARVSPSHKSRIVALYQRLGEVVAVTGDGVNDAIALKQADVGISMGKVGTDVARETSDIIITDDNFVTIVQAVEEGRNVVKRLKNSLKYLLSTNASEALSLMVGLILGIPSLFYAIQIVYVNFISDGIPALALAFSPREEHSMSRPPEKKLQLLKRSDTLYVMLVALVATGIIVSSYFIFKSLGEGIAKTAAFSVLTMIQSFVFVDMWLSHRSIKHLNKSFSKLFLGAFMMPIFFQYLIVSIPFLANLFKVEVVSFWLFLQWIVLSSSVLLGINLIKKVAKLESR